MQVFCCVEEVRVLSHKFFVLIFFFLLFFFTNYRPDILGWNNLKICLPNISSILIIISTYFDEEGQPF